MKDSFKRVPILMSALLAAYSGTSNALDFDQVDYYLALDGQWGVHKLRPVWETFFKNHTFGADVAFGVRPSKYWGVELGYGWTTRKGSATTISAGQSFAGMTNTSGGALTINSKLRMLSTNFDLNGYIPIRDTWEALGYVGMGWARFKPKFSLSTAAANGFEALHSLRSKTRSHFRAGIGVQGMLTDNMGLRFKFGYAGTSKVKFRNMTGISAESSPSQRSYVGGVGLYWYV